MIVRPTAEQQGVEQLFPAIAQWVRGYTHIEMGDQEMLGFVARALDYGGQVFEDDRPDTLGEALAPLERDRSRVERDKRTEGHRAPHATGSGLRRRMAEGRGPQPPGGGWAQRTSSSRTRRGSRSW